MNENQIVDIWVSLKEYFDKRQIEAVASKYVDVLVDNGFTDQQLKAVVGNDDDLDRAIDYYLDEFESDDEDEIDYDAEDWEYGDDE